VKSLNEKCAVVGVFNVDNASKYSYYALFSMQHRGQEATGISSNDEGKHHLIKNSGLVTSVFDDRSFGILKGKAAVGHNRYSTAGDDSLLDAQPVYAKYDLGEISIVHNGNLTNAKEIRDALIQKGAIFQTSMDTENLIHLIAKSNKGKLIDRILDALDKIKGAYSLIVQSRSKMFAIRDPHGFRPLALAKLNDGYIVASETCAFDLVGAEYIRDINPGEMLVFEDGKEPLSIEFAKPTPKHCIFEYVYFARPDSQIFGQNVYKTRKAMGKLLAKELPVDADVVVPVPDSGVAAALGYSEESGIPFELGIIRNHYIGRTFIEPTQELRDLKVKMKLNPIREIIDGKRVVVIDDSIVRGTTSKKIVKLLKEAGASEVHMRISSPPTSYPCLYGIDTPDKEELISNNLSCDEICSYIGATSLAYIGIDNLKRSVNTTVDCGKYCTTCFDGEYVV
jgi:amidophosphoribosyltransferase